MLSSRILVNLSKSIESVILNSTQIDEYGFVPVEDIIEELNNIPEWEHVIPGDIIDVIKGSPLRRLELVGNKIRLVRLNKNLSVSNEDEIMPPRKLFYGTNNIATKRISKFGIKSFKDQYVKLFPEKNMVQVLMHRNSHLAYIEIDSLKAYKDGIKFFKGGFNTYLCRYIPVDYIIKIS